MLKKLGKLDAELKQFLLLNVADNEEIVKKFWDNPVKFPIDKKRIGYAVAMLSIFNGKFVWNINIRISKKYDFKYAQVKFLAKVQMNQVKALLTEFYSEVGVDDKENQIFLDYGTSLHYVKFLTEEEIAEIPAREVYNEVN